MWVLSVVEFRACVAADCGLALQRARLMFLIFIAFVFLRLLPAALPTGSSCTSRTIPQPQRGDFLGESCEVTGPHLIVRLWMQGGDLRLQRIWFCGLHRNAFGALPQLLKPVAPAITC